jgi:hypothetical protein
VIEVDKLCPIRLDCFVANGALIDWNQKMYEMIAQTHHKRPHLTPLYGFFHNIYSGQLNFMSSKIIAV